MDRDRYWKGRYEEITSYRNKLIEELGLWKVAFGWTLAGLIIGLIVAVIA